MKAVYITHFGSGNNLEFRDVPDPGPLRNGEVLIATRAAGLNRADLLQRRGMYPPPEGYSPNIPGLEIAGEVIEASESVCWKAGDRVCGIVGGGGQAEYAVIDQKQLSRVPENLTFAEAAALPEAFITANDAIFTQARLGSGETLLIHAVGSGVGLAALQLAKTMGATVIGTSRTADKLDKAKHFGLDIGILTGKDTDFSEAVAEATNDTGADVILDLVGAAYFEQNLRSLAVKGRFLLVGLPSGRKAEFDLGMALSRRACIIGTMLRSRSAEEKADLTREFTNSVIPLLERGDVVPNIDRIFPAHDAVAAYERLGSNSTFGKVVLEF
jgi:NADPH:quinone reductase